MRAGRSSISAQEFQIILIKIFFRDVFDDFCVINRNNAHALFARPMVTSPDASIAIEVEASGYDAMVFCDGRREMSVPAGGRLEVTRCGTPLKWVRLDSAPFTDRLVRKFRLPVMGWRGQ